MTLRTTKRRKGFSSTPLHRKKEPHAAHYLSERMTFWVAILSVLAFVTGNMMGQHGWRVFWKSVLGGSDDSLIVYAGTVSPLARIPDYRAWSLYGGDAKVHTYAEAPSSVLISLPTYVSSVMRTGGDGLVYSVGYMGNYSTGAEGSGDHPGVDIRVPVGTPVQSIMNGVVVSVREDGGGFGKYVVIRHPNVPDPAQPSKTTTLYSAYAHLSAQEVIEGQIVQRGQEIGKSGQSGLASGPHLHFQIDRDTATDGTKVTSHPYWPFTTAEASAAGYTFNQAIEHGLNQSKAYASTVNPMLYVQADYVPVLVASASSSSRSTMTAAERRAERIQKRIADRTQAVAAASSSSQTAVAVVETQTLAYADESVSSVSSSSSSSSSSSARQLTVATRGFADIDVRVPSTFTGRKWETVELTLLDQNGNAIENPSLDGDIYLFTAYGKAEFRPSVLSGLDFVDGKATVQMLPLTHTTIVVQVQPRNILSAPMRFAK